MVEVNVTLTPIDIAVSGAEPGVTLTVGGGIGPAAVYNTALTQLVGVNPIAAGKNIAISTAGGSFTISASDPPVVSVQGRTGSVVLTLQDVSAATAQHTHAIVEVTGLTAALAAKASTAHTHTISDVTGLQTALDGKQASGSYATLVNGLVPSAQLPSYVDDVLEYSTQSAFPATGETGKIYVATSTGKAYRWSGSAYVEIVPSPGTTDALTEGSTNLYFTSSRALSAVQSALDGKAATSHTHVAANITNLTTVANVVSVNGITGTPSIVAGANVTVSTSGSSITIAGAGNVASVNGKTGTVSLTSVDVSAASASHSHVAANITDLTSVANVVSVNGKAGVVSLVAADVTAASASHGHSYVTSLNGGTGGITIVAGSNVTVTTAASSITIAAAASAGGGGGGDYTLPTASDTVLGGIKVGANLTITDGVLAATGGGGGGGSFSWSSVPASPSASGSNGDVAYDASYFYVKSASGWRRTAIASWTPLGSPTSVTAAGGNSQATVSWTAPAETGGYAITDYVVQYSSNNGSSWTTFADGTSTDTSAVVTSLTNGTAYMFRVAAVTATGTGPYSSASDSVTPGVASDPFFSSVALLLHADGSGSTFVDSSGTPKTITAVGGATQSTAQSKWGGKSLALNGSDANLSLPSSALAFTGDFVIEGWIYLISNPIYSSIVETRASPSFADFVAGVYPIGGGHRLDFVTAGGVRLTGSSTSVPLGSWSHFAFVRSSGVISAYVDGVRDATQLSYSASISPASATALIGRNVDGNFINGYIDDLRITVGSARGYTGSTITVPTAAFPEGAAGSDPFFSSVALLLHADGSGSTFVDSSGAPKTITANGNATQSATQSKWGGKSLAMDGQNGTYLSVPATGLSFGTGDFCIEGWWYFTAPSAYQYFMASDSMNGGYFQWALNGMASNAIGIGRTNVDWPLVWSGHNIQANTWTHVAVSRASGVARCYVNGTRIGNEISDSTNFTTGPNALHIGRQAATGAMTGYIDDLRITVGSARGMTGATITVPTAAFPDAGPPVSFVAIPLMTSATAPSGTASASAILGAGLDAWRAFDKATVPNDSTFYGSPSPATNSWIQYDFGDGSASGIGGYTITSRNLSGYGDSSSNLSQVPSAWTLSGSSDGTTYTVIDTRTGESFTPGQTRTFTLSSPAAYRVYRWTWTANPAGGAVIVPKIQLVAPAD
jgi:hypothetical protein